MARRELGDMAVGVINQLEIQKEQFEVVLIGSLHGVLIILDKTLLRGSSRNRFTRAICPLERPSPPVVGEVLLGMEAAGLVMPRTINASGR